MEFRSRRPSVAWCGLALAAAATYAFANGQYAHPLASWVAPALLLGLARSRRPLAGLGAAYLAFLAAWLVSWPAVFRFPPAALVPTAVIMSALGFTPYLLDRWLTPRLPALLGSLVFPSASVAMEFGLSGVSPFGAWGMLGYSQAEWLPVAQMAAFVGVFGVSFLLCWFAAIANLIWARPDRWRAPAAVFAAVLLLAVGGGSLRLLAEPPTRMLRVAMVLPSLEDNYDTALAPSLQAELLANSEDAASQGAELIVWPEDSFFIQQADEAPLLARAARLAAGRHVHLGLAYGLRIGPAPLRYRNRFVLIGPDGQVAWRYDKAYPTPGYEQAHMVSGDGRIARARTRFGEIAGAICFDGDHPATLRQTGPAGLLVLPSDDWPAIRTLHARMVRFRAIEQGVRLVRPTINGEPLMVDALGRLATTSRGRVMIGDLPPARPAALYARTGPLFAWACLLLLALLVVLGLRRRVAPLPLGARPV